MRKISYLLWSVLTLGACAGLPKSPIASSTQKIYTGKGSEDLVLDTFQNAARLLISCNDHRLREKAAEGQIYAYDLKKGGENAVLLPRKGEPAGLKFHPHGISIVPTAAEPLLYVVTHLDSFHRHPILVYKVLPESLLFVDSIEHKVVYTPNSVAALRNGAFFATNDLGKRNNRIEAVFKQKKGNIAYCDSMGCRRVAEKLSYANGLLLSPDEKQLYVSTTSQNRVFRYDVAPDGALSGRVLVAKVKGGDNLRWYTGQNDLLVAAHFNFLAFAAHAANPKKPSPSVIYKVDAKTGAKTALFSDKGRRISAASGAVYYDGVLYVGQVFENFILAVKQSDK